MSINRNFLLNLLAITYNISVSIIVLNNNGYFFPLFEHKPKLMYSLKSGVHILFFFYLFSFVDSRILDHNTGTWYSHIPFDMSFRNNQYCSVYCIPLQRFLQRIPDSPFEGRNIDPLYKYISRDKTVHNV